MAESSFRLGVDIGGTFTDLVLLDGATGALHNGKVLTTPADPSEGVLAGVREILARTGTAPGEVGHVIHGTTLVANALIERRGVPVGLLTTQGFRDVLEIGTELRFETYDLLLDMPKPLVPRQHRLGVPERVGPDGTVLLPLDEAAALQAVRTLLDGGVEAIAVCLLHAFRNTVHELRLRAIVKEEAPDTVLCLSHEVAPEIGEYERTSTTVCNAAVLPLFGRYLHRLSEGLRTLGLRHGLFLMLSDGGTVDGETAARHPIRLVQSGPAGGAQAARLHGEAAGAARVLCFDMGGTTAKACLIEDGEPDRSLDFEVARTHRFRKGSGLPLKVPVIDMIEIGAGGGSIARLDRLGLIRMGPDSAGAEPGPACYGRGGAEPTVTDADLLIGYLAPQNFLGGDMTLDVAAAERALAARIGDPLGLSPVEAAWAVHETVNNAMAQAAGIHALEKARSITAYDMVPIGGAGPVHAAHIAIKLGLARLIVPPGAGVASALGFLAAPTSFAFMQGWIVPLEALDFAALRELLARLEREGQEMLGRAGVSAAAATTRAVGALRYLGQGFQVEAEMPSDAIEAGDRTAMRDAFEAEYLRQYGRTEPRMAVECVSWRVVVAGPRPSIRLPGGEVVGRGALVPKGQRRAWFNAGFLEAAVFDRAAIAPGEEIVGPALVEERESTLVVPPGCTARCDQAMNLLITLPR